MEFNRGIRSTIATGAAILVMVFAGSVLTVHRTAAQESNERGLQATVEVRSPFAHVGEPLMVRLTIYNGGEKPYEDGSAINVLSGFTVQSAEQGPLKLKGKLESDPKRQPAVIVAGGFFGVVQDLTAVVSDMDHPDSYTIGWKGAGVTSNTLTVRIIPKFDPGAHYVAVLDTDYGSMEFDLLSKSAPLHVGNFFDLAYQGFYDNSNFHLIIKGVELRGGDPTGTGLGRAIYPIQPEISPDLKHRRGTLSMVHLPAVKQDNGSQFVITLSSVEGYDGFLSIFGQLRKGEETLQALENIPTSGQYKSPVFTPLKPVLIKSVTVKKAEDVKDTSSR